MIDGRRAVRFEAAVNGGAETFRQPATDCTQPSVQDATPLIGNRADDAGQAYPVGNHVVGRSAIDRAETDDTRLLRIEGPRYHATSSHGSGCTHSSALASYLALGLDPLAAVRSARALAAEAVGNGLDSIGEGPGPVDVFGLKGELPH